MNYDANTQFAVGQTGLADLVSDGERIYWATQSEIRSLASNDASGDWTDLAIEQDLPVDIAVGDSRVVWINADGAVNAVPKLGGKVVKLATAPGVRYVAIDGDDVYYATSDEVGSVQCGSE